MITGLGEKKIPHVPRIIFAKISQSQKFLIYTVDVLIEHTSNLLFDTWCIQEFLAGLQSNSGLWIDDVRLSVRPSVNIWLTSAFKFVLGLINQYRLDTLHVYRPW